MSKRISGRGRRKTKTVFLWQESGFKDEAARSPLHFGPKWDIGARFPLLPQTMKQQHTVEHRTGFKTLGKRRLRKGIQETEIEEDGSWARHREGSAGGAWHDLEWKRQGQVLGETTAARACTAQRNQRRESCIGGNPRHLQMGQSTPGALTGTNTWGGHLRSGENDAETPEGTVLHADTGLETVLSPTDQTTNPQHSQDSG